MSASKGLVGLISSEPIGPTMAGIGIRYQILSRHLSAAGFQVHAMAPMRDESAGATSTVEAYSDGRLAELAPSFDAVIAQGELASRSAQALPASTPLVIDLYDPWLIENLNYPHLGPEVLQRDLNAWQTQLRRGDFFLTSTEDQRKYYLGFLTAMGRLTSTAYARDPTLRDLIATVPFCLDGPPPKHRPWLNDLGRADDSDSLPRILFGGIYDWLRPLDVLRAMDLLDWPAHLIFQHSPNPDSTPQQRFREARTWALDRGLVNRRVHFLPWAPVDRRFDLFRDVDLMAIAHQPSLESDLSLRTRVVEAVHCGVPVVSTRGGAAAHLLERTGAGYGADAADPQSMADAIRRGLQPDPLRESGRSAFLEWFKPASALAPLLEYLTERIPRHA